MSSDDGRTIGFQLEGADEGKPSDRERPKTIGAAASPVGGRAVSFGTRRERRAEGNAPALARQNASACVRSGEGSKSSTGHLAWRGRQVARPRERVRWSVG